MDGVVAQLVEHHNGIVGVIGSNPFGSTILFFRDLRFVGGTEKFASHFPFPSHYLADYDFQHHFGTGYFG
jgi:hypothetical protein